jgi:NADPH:quinone reductase-like Zn-dependent oxidoreductase
MRQAIIRRHGAPDVFAIEQADDPQPGPGSVRIRVRAAGVNFADILARIGLYPDAPKPPMVVGYEVAGVIDAVGAGTCRYRPGERVVAFTRFGGYADCVVVPAELAFPAPAALSDAEAAAVPVNYVTAMIALYKLANLAVGETVLLYGAAGGVGVAATQLALLRRATIIGTASAIKHDALRAFGVAHAIDSRHGNVEEDVLRITHGRGVDVILDPNGGDSFARSYRLLAPLGRLVMFGVSSLATGERRHWWPVLQGVLRMRGFRPLSLINRNRGVFGLNFGHLWSEWRQLSSAMDQLLEELRSGRLQPVIARTFPLEQVGEAHRYIQRRANIGKVVLTT